MKALRFTTPNESQLELQFEVDGRGAERLGHDSKGQGTMRLMRVMIDECKCDLLYKLLVLMTACSVVMRAAHVLDCLRAYLTPQLAGGDDLVATFRQSAATSAFLIRVGLCCCSAHELSELITKLLNKLYTQQDFKPALVSPQGSVARMSLAAAQPTVLPMAQKT